MGFIQDIKPIFKKNNIKLREKIQEDNHIFTFIFEKSDQLNWKAGQHGVFSIAHRKVNKPTRPFSIASAASEDKIQISMQITNNPSEFKQAMLELEPGMEICMRGPIGPMYIDSPQKPTLFIAGGLGITPFRAIIKDLTSQNHNEPIYTLFYIDSSENFLYSNELDELAIKHPSINVQYYQKRNSLYNDISTYITSNGNKGYYYAAGTQTMVASISNFLKSKNVKKGNIKKDIFRGYKS
ncbi:FAD-dependent oxidoreductase [Rossellomorea yichunensis]|uniref:FAD-dependent oxidoreductase n=1 Tax=Rossellomorea yichunensis TaxID=3077331 RepID=UPI0028DD5828|nr:FAD-dependent oxidoreductase [Rossellomorea sp. YC4-1]MDT9027500.1 FAD-dependent oxidoreductase [Rossellomorea sp. YC4-1]